MPRSLRIRPRIGSSRPPRAGYSSWFGVSSHHRAAPTRFALYAMSLRLKSLKTRTALAIASVVVVTLVINAVYLILKKKSELRADILQESQTFAELTKKPLAVGWEGNQDTSFYRSPFRVAVRDTLRLNTDVERILIADYNGRVLFDSTELDELDPRRQASPPDRWIQEPDRLAAIQGLETRALPNRDTRGEPG